jgi:hypothetical protein
MKEAPTLAEYIDGAAVPWTRRLSNVTIAAGGYGERTREVWKKAYEEKPEWAEAQWAKLCAKKAAEAEEEA